MFTSQLLDPVLSARPSPSPPPTKPHHLSRLQPSPSLPDIRSSIRPSSPRVEMSSSPAHTQDRKPSHAKYIPSTPTQNRYPKKKDHHRRKPEKNAPRVVQVLTPPLTPSSSIRTTDSQESIASVLPSLGDSSNALKYEEEIAARDPAVTRFLLVEDLDPTADYNTIHAAIEQAFTPSNRPEVLKLPFIFVPRSERDKEAFQTALQETGTAPLVFFDTRAAFAVSDAIANRRKDTPGFGSLFKESAPREPYRFIQTDEFLTLLKNPPWLDVIPTEFYMSITKAELPHLGQPPTPSEDQEPDGDPSFYREGLNISILHSILRGHGEIRSFDFSRMEVRQDQTISLIYRVEFYDVRDAITSSTSLAQMTLFKMAISVHAPASVGGMDTSDSSRCRIFSPDTKPASRPPLHPLSVPQVYSKDDSDLANAIICLRLEREGVQHSLPSPPHIYHATPFPNPSVTGNTAQGHNPQLTHLGRVEHVATGPQYGPHIPPPPSQDASTTEKKNGGCGTPGCSYCPSQNPNTQMFPPPPGGVPQYASQYPYSPPPVFYPPSARHHLALPPGTHTHPSPPGQYHQPPMVPGQYEVPPTNWYSRPTFEPNNGYYPPAYLPALDGRHGMEQGPFNSGPVPSPPRPFIPYDASHVLGPHPGMQHVPQIPYGPQLPPPQVLGPPMMNIGNASPPHEQILINGNPIHAPPVPVTIVPTPVESPLTHASAESTFAGTEGELIPSGTNALIPAPPTAVPVPVGDPNVKILSGSPVDLEAIRNGMDTRTTVMIRNVPNKLTDKQLLDIINQICPRRIDFLYLRIDFKKRANLGYAFVNFIDVRDLLIFAEHKLGTQWGLYSSSKVLALTYAVYQGKEALVEKFKNSCIMDEQEGWRPKIFYSSGPHIGLPEPFPVPTHQRRKERSSANRHALYGPEGGPGDLRVSRGKLHNRGTRPIGSGALSGLKGGGGGVHVPRDRRGGGGQGQGLNGVGSGVHGQGNGNPNGQRLHANGTQHRQGRAHFNEGPLGLHHRLHEGQRTALSQ